MKHPRISTRVAFDPTKALRKSLALAGAIACLAAPGLTVAAQTLTYVDLVDRLTNLEELSVLPAVGERCAQWSSYDRQSRYDEATGKYVGWDANGDGGGFIRHEGSQIVMAEMEGPGCIWRIWSAKPTNGRVKIYLDGAAEPVVDLPFIGYFDGKNEPFTRSALVHTVAQGWNNYTPIPYQKSCKIVAEPDWGMYYQFVYQTFPAGVQVPTFKLPLTADESKALNRANDVLRKSNYSQTRQFAGETTERKTVVIRPGSTANLASLGGSGAIVGLRARLDLPQPPADRDLLRELAIQIFWDGDKFPSVWAPFGDFFGTTDSNNYRSLPLGHSGDEWWYCNWYMPFGQGAEVQLVNEGNAPRTITVEIRHAPLTRSIAELGRFHAKWHRDALLPAEPERAIDWTMLQTHGRGRFVGVMLHVWNPRGGWWGEGDEKFFVDGEKFPSTIGTGSEDYFGYAWCDPGLFENAYHNQPQNDGNNRGHVTVNRWHVADNVPFQNSFEGSIEKYFPNSRPTLYASTVFWYLAPSGKDPYPPMPVGQRVGYWTPVESYKVKGAIEGESLKIVSRSAGNPHEQELSGFGDQWSNDSHLWWISAKPGDTLELEVPSTTSGQAELVMQLTKAPDYGIVQLFWNGRKLGEPVDLFHAAVVPTGALQFGSVDVTPRNILKVEIIGANDRAVKSYMFGLDYLKLQKP